MSQSISKVEGNLLTKSDTIEALWLWDACSETNHQKDKILQISIFNSALSLSTQIGVLMRMRNASEEGRHYKRQTTSMIWEERGHPPQNAYF